LILFILFKKKIEHIYFYDKVELIKIKKERNRNAENKEFKVE